MGEKLQNAKAVVAETIEDNMEIIPIGLGYLVGIAIAIPLAIWGYQTIGKLQGRGFVSECRKSGLFGSN